MAMVSIVACTKQKTGNTGNGESDGIFSNRPIGAVEDMYVFTFNSPALLATALKTNKGLQIPQDAKDKVMAEHAAFEAKLQATAPGAKIIYHYHLAINGMAVYVSSDYAEKLSRLSMVKRVSAVMPMARPREVSLQPGQPVEKVNSVSYIGADKTHQLGFTGAGMRIGILDTGVDYTHTMLGGSGQGFADIDRAKPNAAFPNSKVVGGTDLVGSDFDAASIFTARHLPQPDPNPLDEQGHGSHVAGTIAGVGDGVNTYSGVAPDAQIYAVKVFGKEGSTMDAVVVAALEYSVDPNQDLDPSDRLDVVNLSLGGGFGQPQVLYSEAVRNVSKAGTVVVASAGNSGAVDYIVGDPSTADNALSVAASVDGADINWRYPAAKFSSVKNPELYARIYDGAITLPCARADGISGELVDIGLADQDLSDDVKAKLKGKVALIGRGKVPFIEKLTRAKSAGAIGAVVYTNDGGEPIIMGGEGATFDIPAFMVTQAMGLGLQADMKLGPVSVTFKTDHMIEKPEQIDQIADFSSKGPRSEDSMFKPEISAPGRNITSAEMGGGHTGVLMDGTSMAAPHITGAVALIRQAHPELSAEEIKALVMNTTRVLHKGDEEIPMTFQGSGLIQIDEAVQAQIVSDIGALSLGRVQLGQNKTDTRTIKLRNLTAQKMTLTIASENPTPGLIFELPARVVVPASGEASVTVKITYELQNSKDFASELNGRILFIRGERVVLKIPAMAIRTEASQIKAQAGAAGKVDLLNASPVGGLAAAFNLLGTDAKKANPPGNEAWMNRSCDLRSVGYRIIREDTPQGPVEKVQFAFNLYSPVTTWHMCSLSVLIDRDGDGIADQELAGVAGGALEGVNKTFTTLLLDAPKARDIRLQYEKLLSSSTAQKDAAPDYTPAVLSESAMAPFNHSSLAVLESPMKPLALAPDGKLHIKVAAQSESGETFEGDDFLGEDAGQWLTLSPKLEDQAFYGMEEITVVPAAGASLTTTKGAGTEKLILYYPFNDVQTKGAEGQEQILEAN